MNKLDAFDRLYDAATGGWRMPPWLSEPFDPGKVNDWLKTYDLWFSPVEQEVGRFYNALTMMLRPYRILETGTNAGYSTYCIARALKDLGGDRRIYTIDLGPAAHLFANSEVESRITFIAANSLEVDLQLLSGNGDLPKFDMLFLDSDHHYKTIVAEINRYAPLLAIGGTMILHDTMYYDGIALAVRQLQAEGSFEVVNLPTPRQANPGERCPGITVARKIRQVVPGFLIENPAFLEIEINAPGRGVQDPPLV